MSLYQFQCQKEGTLFYYQYDNPGVPTHLITRCPVCGSKRVQATGRRYPLLNEKNDGSEYSDKIETCCHQVAFSYDLSGFNWPLTDELRQRLEEHALERAKEMIIEGYREGELVFCHPDTEEEILGTWEIDWDSYK